MIETYYYGPQTEQNNEAIGEFVSVNVFGKPGAFEKFCTMAVVENDILIGGTVYHNWQPECGVIELTSAATSKRWLTKKVIYAMFDLAFARLACQLVVLRVSERNIGMCQIARKFGFSEVKIPRLRGRDEAEYIFTYTDDQWRTSPYNKGAT